MQEDIKLESGATDEEYPVSSKIPKPAGFFYRLLAFEIDVFLLWIVSQGVFSMVSPVMDWLGLMHWKSVYSTLFFTLSLLLYFPLFEGSRLKSTPGKRCLGMRVTDLRGVQISRIKSFKRLILGGVFLIPLMAGFFFMLRSKKGQAWSDRIEKTLVLKKQEKLNYLGPLINHESGIVIALSILVLIPSFVSGVFYASSIVDPLWKNHQRKNRIEVAIASVKPIQDFVESYVARQKNFPKKIDTEIFNSSAERSKSIVLYNPNNGVILIQLGDVKKSELAAISLYPLTSSKGAVTWKCTPFAIKQNILPDECKIK